MKNLTPVIVLQFHGKSSMKEMYQIVLRNVVDITRTMTEKEEILNTKSLLKEAIAVLETKESHIWERENGY